MSKASQRRLAEQQKRVEKLKREDPHFKARVELLEMDPADVFANPVRYWTRLSNATEADAPHADHAFLDAAFEWKVELFEVLHDALLYEQDRLYVGAEGPFLPGLTMGFDEDGWITSFLPQSPVFTPAPAKGTKWGAHLADLQSRTGQTLAGVEGWFWIISSFEPGLPLFVMGASKAGAGRLWIHVEGKWIKCRSTDFLTPVHKDLSESEFQHPHHAPKRALTSALAAGTIARGSETSEIPGTPNAVSNLVTGFAEPYVGLISTLLERLVESVENEEFDLEHQIAHQAQGRRALKDELANVQKLLAAERLVSAGLRNDLRARQTQPSMSAHSGVHTPTDPLPLRRRLGVFFGQ